MENCLTEKLFNEIKDGDLLGFYCNSLFGKITQFVEKMDFLGLDYKISHIGIVYNIDRQVKSNNENEYIEILTFCLSEQVYTGGLFDKWKITKTPNPLLSGSFRYKIEAETQDHVLYWKSFSKPLSPLQKDLGVADAIKQIGQKYGASRFIFCIPFVSKLLGHILGKRANYWFMNRRVCSIHVWSNLFKSNRIDNKEFDLDPQPTPAFVSAYTGGSCGGVFYRITDFKDNI